MKTPALNPVTDFISVFFNLIPKFKSFIEGVVQKALTYKQQSTSSITGLAAWIFAFVILALRLDAALFCMYSKTCYRKKSSTLTPGIN